MNSQEGLTMTVTLMAVFLLYFASVLAALEMRENKDWWAAGRCLIYAFFASSMLAGRISWVIEHYMEVPK